MQIHDFPQDLCSQYTVTDTICQEINEMGIDFK